MEKDIVSMSVGELFDLFERERKNALDRNARKSNSNDKAQANKCEFVQYLLDSVPQDIMLTVEGCRGDGIVRSFNLANAGSVVECIVKYHLTKARDIAKTWNKDDRDVLSGCIGWEVKASCGAKFLATPSKSELTLLINLDGVSLIKKSRVLDYVNNANRLPARGVFGNRSFMVEYLEKALGLEEGYQG